MARLGSHATASSQSTQGASQGSPEAKAQATEGLLERGSRVDREKDERRIPERGT